MPNRTDSEIRARVDAFVAELSTSIRQAALQALQAVQQALGGAGARTAAPAAPRRKKVATRKKAGRRSRQVGKRADTATVLAALQAAGGPVRAETLAAALGTKSPALKPALDELVASKQVKRAGMARGTTYAAGSGGGAPKQKAAKKAARKRSKKAGRRKATTK